MALTPEDDDYIWTGDRPDYALKHPRFIVKHRGRYYLTRALWEYDPEQATLDYQKEGVAQIQQVFDEQLRNAGATPTVEVPETLALTTGHTTPQPPPPGPGTG